MRRIVVSLVVFAVFAAVARAQPSPQFPAEVAGFHFGMSQAQARQTCRAARGRWRTNPGDGTSRTCSVAPEDVSFPTPAVMVSFCGNSACGVFLMSNVYRDPGVLFARLLGLLTEKYGPPCEVADAPDPRLARYGSEISTTLKLRAFCVAGGSIRLIASRYNNGQGDISIFYNNSQSEAQNAAVRERAAPHL